MFRKAERKVAKQRLALIGPSGAGKTYSALLIAKGLCGQIAMIDTEHGSGSLLRTWPTTTCSSSIVCPMHGPVLEGAWRFRTR